MKKKKESCPVQVGYIGIFTDKPDELEWNRLYVDIGNKRRYEKNMKKLYKKLRDRALKGCKNEY